MIDTLFTPVNRERTVNDHLTENVYKNVDANEPIAEVVEQNSVKELLVNIPVVEQEPQAVPSFVKKRLDSWYIAIWGFAICRYLFGIGGILAATIAAVSTNADARTYFSVIAAICIAIIGFVKPDDSYRRHVVAWRYLDAKVNLYTYRLISIKELLNAMSEAEQMIDLTQSNIRTYTESSGL
ncbi:MAG: hypothetical protein JWP67_2521 [Mucilaginibacter sp.]|nr:hypothetical protein [Mucilaginibacter sp.]